MPAITGWDWLKQGTGLFRKQPAALTTLLFANLLISVLINRVPLLGPLVAFVLIPSFSMAFMKACLMIENEERVTPAVLLTGFRKPVLGPLCKVGVVFLVVSLLLALLAGAILDRELLNQVTGRVDPHNVPPVPAIELVKMFGLSLLNIGVLVVLSFAAPLIYWQHMYPSKAVFYSFFSVVKSARVFLVLLSTRLGLMLACCLLVVTLLGNSTLGLVFAMGMAFQFILLLQCAMYAGYRQIFGKPVEADAKPVNLDK